MSRSRLACFAVGVCLFAAPARAQCGEAACLSVSARPVTVTLPEAHLLDATLSSLLGLTIDLAPGDYQALAVVDLTLSDLLDQLQADLSLGSPAAVVHAAITLEQLFDAAASVAASDGHALSSATLALVADDVALATGTIKLADLLEVEPSAELLGGCSISALDLLMSATTLFNAEHATAITEVSLLGAALGLGFQIASVDLGVTASSPPVYACGGQGSSASSAGLRLRARLELVGTSSTLSVAGLSEASLALVALELVSEVAPGIGTLEQIDALAGTLSVEATPGVVGLYLGTISDADMLSASPIQPSTEIAAAIVGRLDVTLLDGSTMASADVTARAVAGSGAAPETTLSFAAPYPKALVAEASEDLSDALADDLIASLEADVSTLAPPVVVETGVLDDLAAAAVDALTSATGLVRPVVLDALEGLTDPLLEGLGGGLGELSVSACSPFELTTCEPDAGVEPEPDAGASSDDAGVDGGELEPDPTEPELDASVAGDAGATEDAAVARDAAVAVDGEVIAPVPDAAQADSGIEGDDSKVARRKRGGCSIAAVAPEPLAAHFWLVTLAGVLLARRVRRLR